MQYLVIGANGYVGSYLYRRFHEDNFSVVGTGHRKSGCMELAYYDMLKDDIEDIISGLKDDDWMGIICIAESNINKCYMDYEHAYNINVVKTRELIKKLQQRHGRILFFSSDNVFDGEKGHYVEEDMTNAINCYGKMKEEMEQYLLDMENTCIFRLARVVSARAVKQNVFFEWDTQFKRNETVRCIKENYNSFISDEDIYQACLIAGEKKMSGLYNIAGDEALTRKELAQRFASYLGKNNVDFVECDLSEFNFKDKRPLNVSMSNAKFIKDADYTFTSMENVMMKYAEQNGLQHIIY